MSKDINPIQVKSKAVCVVYSWMRSWGIDVRLPSGPEESDLVVGGKNIALREDRESVGCDLALYIPDILGTDIESTLAELHRLTQFLGLGEPGGFRKAVKAKRASPDDYEAVSMRLTPFSRTPNIPAEDIQKWLPVLKRETDRAARRCSRILTRMGLDRDDLRTIGMVYMLNYLSRHQNLDNDKINGGNLTLSLIQQFGRWANVTSKFLRNIECADNTAGLPSDAFMGSPGPNYHIDNSLCPQFDIYDLWNCSNAYGASCILDIEFLDRKNPEEEVVFNSEEQRQKWLKKESLKENRYNSKRRRNAQAALEVALAEMPHDKMVFVLSEVKDSIFQHPDARDLAAKKLVDHQSKCSSCTAGRAEAP